MDIKGNQLLKGTGNDVTQIDLLDIEKGIYFIQVEQNNYIYTQKIALQ
ncbi:MAG: T9SS type A sorting domain-containing protein [Crocinitomix sp.]|nr:T9SS type A sorting domain-containing protein [Crocinitomix sp.]